MTPLEAMARAIAKVEAPNAEWDSFEERHHVYFKNVAKAALVTLAGSVSEGMIAKGAGYSDFGFVPGVIENVDDYKKEVRMIFRAMCAAAGDE